MSMSNLIVRIREPVGFNVAVSHCDRSREAICSTTPSDVIEIYGGTFMPMAYGAINFTLKF